MPTNTQQTIEQDAETAANRMGIPWPMPVTNGLLVISPADPRFVAAVKDYLKSEGYFITTEEEFDWAKVKLSVRNSDEKSVEATATGTTAEATAMLRAVCEAFK